MPENADVSLGNLPLGNGLREAKELGKGQKLRPLELSFCDSCGLVQTHDPIGADELMDEYLYFTAASPAVVQYHADMVESLKKAFDIGAESLVVDIGSCDGTLLKEFLRDGIGVLGIEPIEQSVREARDLHGVETVHSLFSEELAQSLSKEGRTADLIISNYVLELVPDVSNFVRGMRQLLKPHGVAVLEVPYAHAMVQGRRFDGIAHLRLSWFTAASLDFIFRQDGLPIFDIAYIPAFRGGTLSFFASREPARERSNRMKDLLDQEKVSGVNTRAYWEKFGAEIEGICSRVKTTVRNLRKEQGARVAGYGAGIKASTALNAVGLTPEGIEFVVDTNTLKQGHFMPGVDIPVCDPARLLEDRPDYVLLLALDHIEEVLEQQGPFRKAGGKFIVPVPEPRIV